MHIVIADQLPASAVDLLSSVAGWTVDAKSGRTPDVLGPALTNADALIVRSLSDPESAAAAPAATAPAPATTPAKRRGT